MAERDEFDDLLGEPEEIEVELDAYVIHRSHRVWKASAGKTHRFYKAVRDNHAVFPDVRGLDALEGDPGTWTDKQILEVITADRWAREEASRARGNQPKGSPETSKEDRVVLTFLKRLWHEAAKGDLIMRGFSFWTVATPAVQSCHRPSDPLRLDPIGRARSGWLRHKRC